MKKNYQKEIYLISYIFIFSLGIGIACTFEDKYKSTIKNYSCKTITDTNSNTTLCGPGGYITEMPEVPLCVSSAPKGMTACTPKTIKRVAASVTSVNCVLENGVCVPKVDDGHFTQYYDAETSETSGEACPTPTPCP
jgi:hypothetical protein